MDFGAAVSDFIHYAALRISPRVARSRQKHTIKSVCEHFNPSLLCKENCEKIIIARKIPHLLRLISNGAGFLSPGHILTLSINSTSSAIRFSLG